MGTAKVILDRKIYLAQFDLSGDENEVNVSWSRDAVPAVVHGDRTRLFKPGLELWSVAQKGYVAYGAGLTDEILEAKIGQTDQPFTVGIQNGLIGETCYFGQVGGYAYQQGLVVGALPSFDFSVMPTSRDLIRGTIMEPKAVFPPTGPGTGRQLGAVSATQKLYAVVHIFVDNGTTLDMTVESDDNAGFSTPTTRITIPQFTTVGSYFATPVAGPITDDHWRFNWGITGSSFTVFAALGIQTTL